MNQQEIQTETWRRWFLSGAIHERNAWEPLDVGQPSCLDTKDDWVVRGYVRVKPIYAIPFKIGCFKIEFFPWTTGGNKLHEHPISDRIVTVLRGTGIFYAPRASDDFEVSLEPGDRIWIPRGALHMFRAGPEELQVYSIHNPCIPFDDPRYIVYQSEIVKRWREMWGGKEAR